MYDYRWFESELCPSISFTEPKPQGWLEPQDIASLHVSRWEEHCLECAAPQCYHNCENWVERRDHRCQKTFYGIREVPTKSGLLPAQLKFRAWGKLETLIYPGMTSVKSHRRLNLLTCKIEYLLLSMSDSSKDKTASPVYRIASRIYYGLLARLLNRIGRSERTDEFLIQCYSPAEREYRLQIEFCSRDGVFYRNSMTVKKGYSQARFDIHDLNLQTEKHSYIRIYPEADIQEDIVFFCTDCIRLNASSAKRHPQPAEKVKCVAWDLDNTVWDGTLIESDPDTLALRPGILETMRVLDSRGILQIAVSKNDLAAVLPQLQRLGIEELLVYTAVNWNAKSKNLEQAAKELNIGLDTFALIDDSPFERGEVADSLPQVRVYPETQVEVLPGLKEFDVPVTADSTRRRAMYQQEKQRRSVQQGFTGTDQEFLKSCGLNVTVEPISDETFLRSFELIQRTNQLNLSGRKYTREEFARLCEKFRNDAYVVKCHDRYGDYGQVGFFTVEKERQSIVISEYAMSCRVAGKWLEPALMRWVCSRYQGRELIFSGVNSEKNGLLIRTLHSFGLVDSAAEEGDLRLSIPVEKMIWPEIVSVTSRSTGS